GAAAQAQDEAQTSETLTLSVEQVTAGRQVAGQACSECHGVTLRGALGPALRDESFLRTWGGRSLSALHDFTVGAMPPAGPGTLPEEDYLAIMAFILSNNGFEASEEGTPITADNLGDIIVE